MANLLKRRGVWYARVRLVRNGVKTEKQVPLRTESKVTARVRLEMVNRDAESIKKGLDISFPWLNNEGINKIVRLTIIDAVEKWLSQRESEGIRKSTIRRNRYSMKSFMSFIGASSLLSKVSTTMIDSYRDFCIQKGMKPDGININLRAIKTFFNWCYRRELINKAPFVDMVSTPKGLPRYLPDRMFNELIKLDWLSEKHRTAFLFLHSTGCRRSEPFLGELHGNWLLIGGDETKQRADKELCLSQINLDRLEMMRHHLEIFNGTLESWKSNLTKTFKKAIREIDGNETKYTLHDLRHTFAVRRYLQTRDIYRVKMEMGHLLVSTTEKYAKFSLRRLEMDFPSLVNSTKINEKRQNGTQKVVHASSKLPINATIQGVS
ncbi:uncharacterized protein METZ01_LOCUS138310 [marine metagenome]|uniref:Tyr recombinase domain-containing protein n=1 Tax=marine metagenome TaxID=408172 RepID=A0A381Z840_9ZZZZ|tara:strand:- start:47 stop:1180 length:1134 start_codon:yes stop_codon:yes gene_type:complete